MSSLSPATPCLTSTGPERTPGGRIRVAFGRALSLVRDQLRIPRQAPPQLLQFPALRPGVAVYCIGDLHGRSDCLRAAHDFIDADCAARKHDSMTQICLGDYVDRGPDSAGVIDALMARAGQRTCHFLRGNHERALSDFLDGRMPLESWRALGGYETIMSYGLDPRTLARNEAVAPSMLAERIPQAHRTFIGSLVNSVRLESYFFVHAGIRPGIPLDQQTERDLLRIRDEFLEATDDFGAVVVHGHTPIPAPELYFNRINLDTGAYATGRVGIARIDASGVAVFVASAGGKGR